MNATMEKELTLVRGKAEQILELARTDSSFREKVAEDPAGVLKAFGVPEQDIHNILSEAARHQVNARACADTTCYISICPATCTVTIPCG